MLRGLALLAGTTLGLAWVVFGAGFYAGACGVRARLCGPVLAVTTVVSWPVSVAVYAGERVGARVAAALPQGDRR